MSVFNADSDIPENPLAELVGEGKKYANEGELAKAYYHAAKTIDQRNEELANTRAELAASAKVEELLSRVRTPEPPIEKNGAEAHQPAKPASLSTEDVAKVVQEQIKAERENSKATENVESVAAKLIEIYGDRDKANDVVKQKAAELGVSVTFLQSTAVQSPKAFFELIGLGQPAGNPAGPTKGNLNPAALSSNPSVKAGTYQFYESMRKENPKQYNSPLTQAQMHKDAIANPDAFFN